MKVLIISHNPISTVNNNGKTMLSLFSSFRKEDICQLFVAPTVPDVEKCNSNFRITDKDVLKSYYKFSVKGREIQPFEIDTSRHVQYESENDEKLYRNPKNKLPTRLLLRDIMWRWAKWYNKRLIEWIRGQQPTHIFVILGTSKFIYNIAQKISKKFHLPIISYICDDYYFVKKSNSLIGRIQQKQLKKKISNLMDKTSHIITICDELNGKYSRYFNVPATTIMTGGTWNIETQLKTGDDIQDIVYMGNIRCNRFQSLIDIGRALDLINEEYNTNFELKIYTNEKDEGILKRFKGIDSIKLCGFVTGSEFEKVFHSADVLLHVEAFDESSVDLVKHSVSTKIADSLGSGICLFGYGPKGVASIEHLIKNDCAIVCSEKSMLKEMLLKLLFDIELRKQKIENALETAKKYHDSIIVSQNLYKIIGKVENENPSN